MSAWTFRPLSDPEIFEVIMGQSPPSTSYNDDVIGLPFYQGKSDFGLISPTPRKYCSEPSRVAEKNDIIISVRAPVGPTNLANKKCCIGRGLAAIRCRKGILPRFLLYALRSIEKDIAGSVQDQGGGFTAIKRDQLKAFEIPVPPLDEQRQIVARIEDLTRRAEEVRKLASAREAELDILLQALYSQMIEGAKWKPLCDVVSLIRRPVEIKPEFEYEEMGVRSFGKGTFAKPLVKGEQLIGKRTFWTQQGDLVFSGIFAWEKAIAVATPEDDGRVASHRFLTYLPYEQKATAEFLCYHFLSNQGIIDIRSASPSGAGGRNRPLSRIKLEKILVPIPDYEKQLRFSDIARQRFEIQKETMKVSSELQVYSAAVVAKAFREEL